MNRAASARRRAQRAAPLVVLLLTLAAAGHADQLLLTNGHSVAGIVEGETDSTVSFRIGTGAMTIRRAQIRSIVRDDAQRNAALEAGWRSRDYLNRRYVPEGYAELAARFRSLADLRARAVEAQRAMVQADDSSRTLAQGLDALRDELVAANRRLQAASPSNDIKAYNALVEKNNALQAAWTVRRGELDRAAAAREGGVEAIAGYLSALQDCGRAVTAARETQRGGAAPDEAVARFIARLSDQLAENTADFQQTSARTFLRGNASIVSVVINGRATGNFIIDTGAELVTLSRSLAEQAGVKLAEGQPASVTVADGSRVAATAVRLDSVQVGDTESRQVVAIVLPSPPAPGIDGLLGMNVLKAFLVQVDRATGRLDLQRFAPH